MNKEKESIWKYGCVICCECDRNKCELYKETKLSLKKKSTNELFDEALKWKMRHQIESNFFIRIILLARKFLSKLILLNEFENELKLRPLLYNKFKDIENFGFYFLLMKGDLDFL